MGDENKFVHGEYYWLKLINGEGWVVARAYRYDGPLTFEIMGIGAYQWTLDDFTESIHIPFPSQPELVSHVS